MNASHYLKTIEIEPERWESFLPFPSLWRCSKISNYLDFFASFFSLAGFWLVFFGKISQPQPQVFFFSVILITSFLFKYLGNNLINLLKFFAYFFSVFSSFNLCRTVLSSFSSSSSYFLSDSTSGRLNWYSLIFPDPWHPHVQTSDNI